MKFVEVKVAIAKSEVIPSTVLFRYFCKCMPHRSNNEQHVTNVSVSDTGPTSIDIVLLIPSDRRDEYSITDLQVLDMTRGEQQVEGYITRFSCQRCGFDPRSAGISFGDPSLILTSAVEKRL